MAKWYQTLTWNITRLTYCNYLRKKYNISATFHGEEPKAPYILIANHAHKHDPFFIGGYINIISYLANTGAVSPLKRLFGKLYAICPKQKGVPDTGTIRQMIQLLKTNNSIGIFAEGDRCWDGETAPIFDNIPALAKKFKVPLFIAKLNGNYLSGPRWATETRKGRITIDFYRIDPTEVEQMPRDELMNKISSILYRNEIKELAGNIIFKSKAPAAGIEQLLWFCPNCHEHDRLSGEKDVITCTHCGAQWQIDGNLTLKVPFDTIMDLKDWHDHQNEQIPEMCSSQTDRPITRTTSVYLKLDINDNDNPYRKGNLYLYPHELKFLPLNKSQPIIFPIDKVKYYVDNFNREFLFTVDDKRHSILFKGKNAYKYICCLDYLHNRTYH